MAKRIRVFILLFLSVLLSGCASDFAPPQETEAQLRQRIHSEIETRNQTEQARRDRYIAAHPRLSEQIKAAIRAGTYAIGMSEADARVCMSELDARLLQVNVTTTAYGTRSQWVLYGGGYLYFKDGILETIQTGF